MCPSALRSSQSQVDLVSRKLKKANLLAQGRLTLKNPLFAILNLAQGPILATPRVHQDAIFSDCNKHLREVDSGLPFHDLTVSEMLDDIIVQDLMRSDHISRVDVLIACNFSKFQTINRTKRDQMVSQPGKISDVQQTSSKKINHGKVIRNGYLTPVSG